MDPALNQKNIFKAGPSVCTSLEIMQMNLLIRPVRLNDAEDINEMRRQIEVRNSTLSLTTETILFTEAFLRSMGIDDHVLVADDLVEVGLLHFGAVGAGRQQGAVDQAPAGRARPAS